MAYNLSRYGLHDRDGDGQDDEPKPLEERQAVAEVIASVNPDVLAVEEIGSEPVFDEFMHRLAEQGVTYDHFEFLHRGRHENNLAVLSRFPIVSRQSRTNDFYTIGDISLAVARGFIDVEIEVNPSYRFRLVTAHLKSKVFHQLGQTEMRRNEARLLGKHVRRLLRENPDLNLLVVGDMNDGFNSAPLLAIKGEQGEFLVDLRPLDYTGDAWTWFGSWGDIYQRLDYLLASRGMVSELIPEKTRVVRDPRTHQASDHRPVVAVFRARNANHQ